MVLNKNAKKKQDNDEVNNEEGEDNNNGNNENVLDNNQKDEDNKFQNNPDKDFSIEETSYERENQKWKSFYVIWLFLPYFVF